MTEAGSAPWAEQPSTGGRSERDGTSLSVEPPELIALRSNLEAVQRRVNRATHQLELAGELEVRLEALLRAPFLLDPRSPRSQEHQVAEQEATGILLAAELRAAAILNAAGPSDQDAEPGRTQGAAALTADVAGPLRDQLRALAGIEDSLVDLARRALLARARARSVQAEEAYATALVLKARQDALAIVADARRRAAELRAAAQPAAGEVRTQGGATELEDLGRMLVTHFELQERLVNLIAEVSI